MVAYTFTLAGVAARVLCTGGAPPSLCYCLEQRWILSRWCERAGLKVSALGIGAWTWGDRTGYWGFEQQGRPDGYGEEENRCCIPLPLLVRLWCWIHSKQTWNLTCSCLLRQGGLSGARGRWRDLLGHRRRWPSNLVALGNPGSQACLRVVVPCARNSPVDLIVTASA